MRKISNHEVSSRRLRSDFVGFSEYIEKDPAKYIDFLIWIDVTGITTEENKEARKMVRKFLCENLVLVDSLETEETK